MAEVKTIGELVRSLEQFDKVGKTQSSKYVSESMRDDVDKTEAYINSKHISGETDYKGRKKPFFNICIGSRNIWYRATDIDRKNIIIRASKARDEIKAFLATLHLQQWMKKERFGKFLNDWGLALATHGSAILKFVEKNGELFCQVMDWNNMIVDSVDFDGNVKIEKLWFTPAQLKRQEGYDQEFVEDLLENLTSRETLGGIRKDNKSGYIPVYEVHGELPLSYLTGKNEDEYVQQVQIISFQKNRKDAKKWDEYTLYSGKEAKSPYMLTHLIKKDGQTYAGGAVKNLFGPQWMVNDNVKMIKDQLELASKIVFQTSDGSFAGKNILTNIENGQILNHALNQPITMLNNKPDITAMQAFKADWQNIASQINGISEAMMGKNPPSGTSGILTQTLLQENYSLFELMTENKGLEIEKMLTDYIIPYFKKQLNNSKEISMMLEDWQIKKIDSWFLPNEATRMLNQKKKNTILSGKVYDTGMEAIDMEQARQRIQENLTGNQRFIKPSEISDKTWKEILKDLEWDLDYEITGESKDVKSVFQALDYTLKFIVGLQGRQMTPDERLLFNRMISLIGGVSPIELNQVSQAQPAPQLAMAGSVGGITPL